MRQRSSKAAPIFCMFHAPVGEILAWSAINRLEEKVGAPQRSENPSKVRAIARFLKEEAVNTIPTAVIVTLRIPSKDVPKVKTGQDAGASVLKFSVKQGVAEPKKPGTVIDGQHRLLGMSKFDPKVHACVVALINANDMETAFQFLVVNNKASKVSTNHLRGLALEFKESELDNRLRLARLSLSDNLALVQLVDRDKTSPFFRTLDWPINRDGAKIVVPAAIETALGYARSKIRTLEDEDVLLEFFFAIWRTIKSRWPELFAESSKLIGKAGLVAMTIFMTDLLVARHDMGELDLTDPDAVSLECARILETQKRDFWSHEWSSSSYDTRAGRQLIVDSLVQVGRNMRAGTPWGADVPILEPS